MCNETEVLIFGVDRFKVKLLTYMPDGARDPGMIASGKVLKRR